ncbi:uncharacterized protein ARMOST_03044 [Armillaria ostoyae]|uniref:NTF2-like protein n=1 Tax=Armillaria ostoyae TaxID=47428 RepID=A0A284QTJ5_ARMOS|nr:uncharacterized protein ARMOST_03044 [Armillaria ostoyae]
MFSSPTPAPGTLASNTLRKAGLIDRDATMRDVTDKPGGRKGSSKIRSHRTRAIETHLGPRTRRDDAFISVAGLCNLATYARSQSSLATRMAPSSSSSLPVTPAALSIRGASLRRAGDRRRAATVVPGLVASNRRNAIEPWKEFVTKRYNPELQLLNLSNMIEDEVVKKHNLTPPGHGGSAKEAGVIFKLAKQLQPPVMKLDLSHNRISGMHLSLLSHYLGGLEALSLQNNNIRTYKDLDIIVGRAGKEQMLRLQELMLSGNPLQVSEYEKSRAEFYKSEVTRRFPAITLLDQEPIVRIAFDIPQASSSSTPVPKPSATSFPFDMGPSMINGASPDLVNSFLFRYLDAFDKNRAALLDVYDPACTFSHCVNTVIPERARLQGLHNKLPNQKKLDWSKWLDVKEGGSRNLSRMRSWADKQDTRLNVGSEATIKALLSLPQTHHDIAGPGENFCVDGIIVPHGTDVALMVMIHGQFAEMPAEGLRSFDRTFILAPAAAGSRAKINGWDVVIVSDQWTIRAYSSPEAWKPGPMLVQAQKRMPRKAQDLSGPADSTPQQQPSQEQLLQQIDEPARSVVLQICQRTGMTVPFGYDCLSRNNWNLEAAIANFEAVKGTLGREAFV